MAVGPFFGTFSRLHEIRKTAALRHRHEYIAPENKPFGFSLAAPVLAMALLIFSWTTRPAVPSIISLLALIPASFAIKEHEYTLVVYLTESYTCFAASAYAPVAIMRALVAAVVPLFGQQIYTGLKVNLASSILAIATTVFRVTPVLFRRYGKTLRMRSPFARRSVPVEQRR